MTPYYLFEDDVKEFHSLYKVRGYSSALSAPIGTLPRTLKEQGSPST